MLTAHNVRPEAASSYYESEDSYYAKGEMACGSLWVGNLAAQVHLEGAVEAEDFRRFIHGRAPNGERVRGINNAGNKTRGGYDLTFSAPKSVSLQALVWNDARVIQAHRQAVAAVLTEIEEKHSLVEIRTGGQRRKEITGKLAIATFTHATSRKLDPQLHTHAIIMNTSYCSDGKWRALRNEGFFRDSRRDLGVQYQRELAANLQQIGYGVVWKPNDTFEITGYTRDQLRAFSQRTVEIEEIAEQKGAKGWREVKHISLQNRPAKELENPQQLQQEWYQRAQEINLPNPKPQQPLDNVNQFPNRDVPQASLISDLRPQIDALAHALRDWQEQQLVSEAVFQVSQNVERTDRLQATAEGMSHQLLSRHHYPQLAELANAIEQQQDIDVLLELGLPDKLNQISRKIDHLLSGQPTLEGIQELAQAIHDTQQLDAVSQHLESIRTLQSKVNQWLEQRPIEKATPVWTPERMIKRPQRPWTKRRLQAVEYLRPKRIEKHHWLECIKDRRLNMPIAARYLESVDGELVHRQAEQGCGWFVEDVEALQDDVTRQLVLTDDVLLGARMQGLGVDVLAFQSLDDAFYHSDEGWVSLRDEFFDVEWQQRKVVLLFKPEPEQEQDKEERALDLARLGRFLNIEGATVTVVPEVNRGQERLSQMERIPLQDWMEQTPEVQQLPEERETEPEIDLDLDDGWEID